ncbi:chemotaxis-specific protein-glutamate methyltransferase CheB [Sphingomonas profundi]|uniref:chemotaxis-specific protein-glutamate methyltransferase CheB n=1 Tax=Alterirhizorhabdus profundi TaxID=2681549 RepID=UPI0012E725C4|nr:chemotaxis-specific protein-glutamate methyltransferase CheB [Sphingomonas profundi]
MIVDDSLVARTVMSRIFAGRTDFTVVAAAANVAQALHLLAATTVDIILLDVQMPGTDGLSALPELLARSRGARVLVVSSSTGAGAGASVRALTLGAADTLLKPDTVDFAGRFAEALVERLLRIGRAPRSVAEGGDPVAEAPAGRAAAAPLECIAIGASTGGPHALSTLLAALPAAMGVPILVTQHLPAAFMPHFAQQLAQISGRPARVAEDGDAPRAGAILLAPGDGHLRLARTADGLRVRIDRSASASGCTPSVDPMLAGLAAAVGPAGLAVVLSGMGRDGLAGAGLVAAQGGEIVVQDAATSVVWGMPGAIARAGLAAAMLPPAAIARRIAERARRTGGVPAWR